MLRLAQAAALSLTLCSCSWPGTLAWSAIDFLPKGTDRDTVSALPPATAPQSDRQWLPPVGVAVDPSKIRPPQQ
jgi:hypothetical protein